MTDDFFTLSPSAPGAWSASGSEQFQRPNGAQFGGYNSGLMMAAVLRAPERRGVPVAMTGVFMAQVAVAPLTVRTTQLRAGNSLQFWQADIVQNGTLCAQSTITLALRPPSGPSFGWIEMPDADAPETLERDAFHPQMPSHRKTFDHRSAKGWPMQGGGDSVSWCWVKDEAGRATDYPCLAMLADMFPPRSRYGTGERGPTSTVSFSIYFHATEDEVGEIGSDYVLLEGRGRRGSGGVCDLTAAIWRRDGLLLATTEQLCWFR